MIGFFQYDISFNINGVIKKENTLNMNNIGHENKKFRRINSTNKLLYNTISNYNTPIKNNENKFGNLNLVGSEI